MNVRFPRAFRDRMMAQNGGEVQFNGEAWWLYPFFDGTDRHSIRKTADDIRRATEQLLSDGIGFPRDAIAIAHNVAGDIMFLRRGDEEAAKDVWVFRVHGGTVSRVLDDVADLWGGIPSRN